MKINIESIDGNRIEIKSDDWDGKIIKMSRSVFMDLKDSGVLPETPAVYIIYADHFDKGQFGKELYIGHTSSIGTRIFSHHSGKQYWSALLIFSSVQDWMNVAYTQNIEYQFIQMAKLANRYDVQNGNDGSITHLGNADQLRLSSFVEPVSGILKMAGIDVFEFNMDGIYSRESPERSSIKVLSIQDRKVEILSGSKIYLDDLSLVAGINSVSVAVGRGNSGVCTFTENTEVVIGGGVIPKLLGVMMTNWKSKNLVSLSKIFK